MTLATIHTGVERPAPATASPGVPASRRSELAAFLRSRRERITPEAVGLPPGSRRRTPGLRREEVAQLAGVGVTWYTWLEQGRPINASVQVVEAIARTLRLDQAEREHLFRLADVPLAGSDAAQGNFGPEIQVILDGINPLPAAIVNGRYDVLAWNTTYGALWPGVTAVPVAERNILWACFKMAEAGNPMIGWRVELPRMVATLRSVFASHLGEPAWTGFIDRMLGLSPLFAQMWATQDVAQTSPRVKAFRTLDGDELSMISNSFAVNAVPETRMAVYTPVDDATRGVLERLYKEASERDICDAVHSKV